MYFDKHDLMIIMMITIKSYLHMFFSDAEVNNLSKSFQDDDWAADSKEDSDWAADSKPSDSWAADSKPSDNWAADSKPVASWGSGGFSSNFSSNKEDSRDSYMSSSSEFNFKLMTVPVSTFLVRH